MTIFDSVGAALTSKWLTVLCLALQARRMRSGCLKCEQDLGPRYCYHWVYHRLLQTARKNAFSVAKR